MISYKRLPGSKGLDGWFDAIDFNTYWNAMKGKVAEIYATGLRISTYQQRIAIAQQKAWKAGNLNAGGALDLELQKVDDDLQKWWKVKTALDTWLPKFMQIERQQADEAKTSGVGVIPALILGVTGIAALAYIVNTGLALVQDYQFKMQLTQDVIDKKISTGQMTDILSVPKKEDILEKTLDKVGLGIGVGIPTALLVGGGLYLLFTTGILNKVIGSVFGGSSSTQASGG